MLITVVANQLTYAGIVRVDEIEWRASVFSPAQETNLEKKNQRCRKIALRKRQ